MSEKKPVAGTGGNLYVPFEKRTGESSVVFFTRDLSEEGLKKIYDKVSSVLTAMGMSPASAEWAVRFSLSPHTTEEEIDYAAGRIGSVYDLLKRFQRR